MSTPIPTYTTIAEVNAAIESQWPDNTTRLIDPLRLRSVVLGIVKYITDYMEYKPEVYTFTNQTTVTLPLNADRLQEFGYLPEPLVFLGDDVGGWFQTSVPWSVNLAPPNTTEITVNMGGPATGFIILK